MAAVTNRHKHLHTHRSNRIDVATSRVQNGRDKGNQMNNCFLFSLPLFFILLLILYLSCVTAWPTDIGSSSKQTHTHTHKSWHHRIRVHLVTITFHGVSSSRKLISFKALTQTTLLNQQISEASEQTKSNNVRSAHVCTLKSGEAIKIQDNDKDVDHRHLTCKQWKCEPIRFLFFSVCFCAISMPNTSFNAKCHYLLKACQMLNAYTPQHSHRSTEWIELSLHNKQPHYK